MCAKKAYLREGDGGRGVCAGQRTWMAWRRIKKRSASTLLKVRKMGRSIKQCVPIKIYVLCYQKGKVLPRETVNYS